MKLLAHPVRLQILEALRRAPLCVSELAGLLARPQPYVSQQLAVLRNAGLLADCRSGAAVYYSLVDERIPMIMDALGLDGLESGEHGMPAAGEPQPVSAGGLP